MTNEMNRLLIKQTAQYLKNDEVIYTYEYEIHAYDPSIDDIDEYSKMVEIILTKGYNEALEKLNEQQKK